MVENLVMYKAIIEITSEYGVMFLHDSKEEPKLIEFIERTPISSDGLSLMFRVQIYVDGESNISISEMGSTSVDGEALEFTIRAESRSVSLSDHTGFVYLNIPLRKNLAAGTIKYDNIKHPNKIYIELSDIYSY